MPRLRTDRPNVIVFFTDQQRWDSVGLHGNPLDLTQALIFMAVTLAGMTFALYRTRVKQA